MSTGALDTLPLPSFPRTRESSRLPEFVVSRAGMLPDGLPFAEVRDCWIPSFEGMTEPYRKARVW